MYNIRNLIYNNAYSINFNDESSMVNENVYYIKQIMNLNANTNKNRKVKTKMSHKINDNKKITRKTYMFLRKYHEI